jgi:hypothetical protein
MARVKEHIKNLTAARAREVTHRREVADALAEKYERAHTEITFISTAERGGLNPALDGTSRRLSRLTAQQVSNNPYGDKCPQRHSAIRPSAELDPSRFRRERRYGLRG